MRRLFYLSALASSFAWAVSLGDLDVSSGLNESLRGTIAVKGLPQSLDDVHLSVASPETYASMGLPYSPLLSQLKLTVDPKRRNRIMVQSQQAVEEPFLVLLVTLRSPEGTLTRKYTVLFDPDELEDADERETRVQEGAMASRRAGSAALKGRYGPIREGETLFSVANRYREGTSLSLAQASALLYEANPSAFAYGNIHGLKKGFYLNLPEPSDRTPSPLDLSEHERAWTDHRVLSPPSSTQTPPSSEGSSAVPAKDKATVATSTEEDQARKSMALAAPSSSGSRPSPPLPAAASASASSTAPPVNVSPSQAATAPVSASDGKSSASLIPIEVKHDFEEIPSMRSAQENTSEIPRDARAELALAAQALEHSRAENLALQKKMIALQDQLSIFENELVRKDEMLLEQEERIAGNLVHPDQIHAQQSGEEGEEDPSSRWLPWLWWGLGGTATLGALLALAHWLSKRSKVKRTALSSDLDSEEGKATAPVTAPTIPVPSPPSLPSSESTPPTAPSVAEPPVPVPDAIDPIEEARAFLDRGRFLQAESILQHVVATQPQRLEAWSHLIDISVRTHNVAQFERLRAALPPAFEQDASCRAALQQAVAHFAPAAKPQEAVACDEKAAPSISEKSPESGPLVTPVPVADREEAPSDSQDEALMTLDFEPGLSPKLEASSHPDSSSASSSLETSKAQTSDAAWELSLSAEEDASLEWIDTDSSVSLDGSDDSKMPPSSQEAKDLELATAYLEIGDLEGALPILQSLLEASDSNIRAQAQALLEAQRS